MKYLIVNADDFGQSAGINRGIIEAHEHGIVTSASLMVRWPAAAAAANYARQHPELSLGLHFDLGEWIYRDGAWQSLYTVAPANDQPAVTQELSRQLDWFRRLVGKDPTHIDSHQHVHREEPVSSVVLMAANEMNIPVRDCSPIVEYCGSFYGQSACGEPYPEGITEAALINILSELKPVVTELGCHPGDGSIDGSETAYVTERVQEKTVLCTPRIREALTTMNIKPISFSDVRSLPGTVESIGAPFSGVGSSSAG